MKKINKYLVFAVALFSLFVVNTKAATLNLTNDINTTFSYLNNTNSLDGSGTVSGKFSTGVNFKYDYNYVVFDYCASGYLDFYTWAVNAKGGYLDNDDIIRYRVGTRCETGGPQGYLYRVQFKVWKWDYPTDLTANSLVLLDSYIRVKNSETYKVYFKFNYIILSNEDILTPLAENQKKHQESLDEQKKTNDKIDKTNDTLTSEDNDTTSKKCGIVCKLKGIFTGIIELPKKIVTLIIDALKSLFVPTDDQLYEIVNDSKELSENFGFVGQSMSFFINIFTSLLGMVNANGCIEMPAFKIGATSLFDEHIFWEARNVCLADNLILSANITTIRSITSIVFVSLFVGFATRKFFSILSKSENEANSE